MSGLRTIAWTLVAFLVLCALGFSVASCVEQPTEPPMPPEAWMLPSPPAPTPVIADAFWSCSFGLSDDARARLRQRCRDDGGSAGPEWRAFYCYARDWKGTVLWKVDAADLPKERTASGGYVEIAPRSFMVLQ